MATRVITGIAGFVGSHLGRYLINKYPDDQLYGFDKLITGNQDNFKDYADNPNFLFLVGDCASRSAIEMLPKFDEVYIVHSEPYERNNPSKFAESNYIGGVLNVLEKAKKNNAKVLYYSTSKVYGESKEEFGSLETDGLFPKCPVAAIKAGADRFVYAYSMTYQIPVIIVRVCNVYGPNQHEKMLIPSFIKNMSDEKPCSIYGTGENIREWMYISDVIEGIVFAINTTISGEIYNIGSGVLKSNREIFDELKKYFDGASQIGVEDIGGNVEKNHIDSDKIKDLGWTPKVNFEEGFKKTVEWYKGELKS